MTDDPASHPTLHVAAFDYVSSPSLDTSDRLVAAGLRATLAEISATGETTGQMREALVLIRQLADERSDSPHLPSSDDDSGVAEPTGVLRLPPLRRRVFHAISAHSNGMTPTELCDLLQISTPGAIAQVLIELRSLAADGLLSTVWPRYFVVGAPEDGAPDGSGQ